MQSGPIATVVRRGVMLAVAAMLVCLRPVPAWSWGCAGHEVVALIAYSYLNPQAAAQVDSLLGAGDDGRRHFCSQRDLPPVALVSTWPDDWRSSRPETAQWHFRDVPLDAAGPLNADSYCPDNQGCVTKAIQAQIAALRDPNSDSGQQSEALIFLIHFVGDLHQPLHCSDNSDRGGNCVPVQFYGQTPRLDRRHPEGEAYRPNLHSIWDSSIIARIGPSRREVRNRRRVKVLDVEAFARQLGQQFAARRTGWMAEPMALDRWSWESHQLAVSIGYEGLPARIRPVSGGPPIQSCADNGTSEHYLELGEEVDDQYVAASGPVIEQQLAKAGAHLAGILNAIWPGSDRSQLSH